MKELEGIIENLENNQTQSLNLWGYGIKKEGAKRLVLPPFVGIEMAEK